jgi:hypothetical protein
MLVGYLKVLAVRRFRPAVVAAAPDRVDVATRLPFSTAGPRPDRLAGL